MKNIYFALFITIIGQLCLIAQKLDTLTINEHPSKKNLSGILDENSGLLYLKDHLFTFNDSGGSPEIYVLNPKTGDIKNTISVTNAINIDWEAITTDGEYIYIGDVGNNRGDRENLAIYKIEVSQIIFDFEYQEIESIVISFKIEGQASYINTNMRHDYDIEAMVFYNNKIHFFTKEWNSNKTTHHTLNPNLTTQISKKIESFSINYLVTDVTIDKNNLILVGYTRESLAFLSIFKINSTDYFFKEPVKKIFLGLTPAIGQVEGVTTCDKYIYISAEALRYNGFFHDQVLYTLDKMY